MSKLKNAEMANALDGGSSGGDSCGGKATEWFWETGQDHRFTYISNEGAAATGLVPSNIIGKSRPDIAADRDDPKWDRHLADLDARRPFWGFEYSIRTADGSLAHLSTSGEPRLGEDGQFLGYRGAASDITARIRVEQELRDARELFNTLMQAAPFEIVFKDREGKYRQVNRTWERNHGRTNEEVVGRHTHEILPSRIADIFASRDRAVLECGRIVESEEPAPHPDGTVHDYLAIRFPLAPGDRPATAGLGLIAMDITARKQAERALLEREEELGTIADNLPVLMARFDRKWRYRFINREGARWYGMPASEIVGRTITDLFPQKAVEDIRPSVEAVLRGENARFAGTMEYPDGKTRNIEVTFAPNRTADGVIQGWFALAQDQTERQKSAEALRKNERQLITITDNLPVLISRFDRQGRFEFINRAGAKWYGRSAGEIVGKTIHEIFSPETSAKIEPWIKRALEGERVRFEERMHYPDGMFRDVDIAYIPDVSPDGEVRGCIALVQNITERKAAESKLRESEARFKAIVDYAPAGIYLKDLDGRILVLNRECLRWYGAREEDVRGQTSRDHFPEPIATRYIEHDRAVINQRKFVSIEDSARYPDGIVRTLMINKFPILDDSGEVVAVGGVDLDITELKNTERSLRESEEQLRTITDNLPAFIIYVDREQRFRFANRVAEEWYRRPASEIIGRQVSEIIAPDSYEMLRPRIEAVLAGQDVRFEDTFLYPDDVTRTVDQRWIADRDENGHTRGWFSLGQDITERKRLEADLLRKERLAAMGQLTGTVAHELRNPLGAVATSIAAVRRLSGDAGLDLERSLARAERGISRSDRIITELLDFARAKGLQREPTRFDQWLSAVLADHDIPESVSLSLNFETGGAEVMIDREDFRRAIINVVDNACQAVTGKHGAGESGIGRVEIGGGVTGDRLICEIRDNGPGIPADRLDQVMEPLFSTKSFGTGLGLPTVQRIMEEHGGGILIESEPDAGALVRLWLPLDTDTPEE